MPYLIPDDWDGETFQCVEIHWPDSPFWWSILRGVLTELARGRTWDESTGIIKDAQAVGWEIWSRSWPFMPCGTTDCPETPANGETGDTVPINVGPCFWDDFISDCEGENMSGCGGSGLPIKIESGKLYWWHCCQWIEVGAIAGLTDEVSDDWAGDPEETDYYACGKASAIVELIFGVAKSCWDERDNYPWQWSGHVKADWPGIQLSTNYIAITVTQAILCTALSFDETDWNTSALKQTARSRIVALMTADANPISSDVYLQIKGILAGLFDFTAAPLGLFLTNALDVIGRGDLSNYAALGATTEPGNCGQYIPPFEPEWPDGMDWEYYWDFETLAEMPDDVALLDSSYFTQGKGVRHYSAASGLGNPTVESIIHATGGTLKAVYLRYTIGAEAGNGDYEGVQVQCTTDVQGFITIADTGDTDPSQGGTFAVLKNQNYVIVGGDGSFFTKLEVRDEGGHTEERTVTIQGLGFAGTGTDPALADT